MKVFKKIYWLFTRRCTKCGRSLIGWGYFDDLVCPHCDLISTEKLIDINN